jgi:hypothetical protein
MDATADRRRRNADRRSDMMSVNDIDFGDLLPRPVRVEGDRSTWMSQHIAGTSSAFWHPVLPPSVPRCALCTLPNRHGLCTACTRLLGTYPADAVKSVEFIALSRRDEFPEIFLWDWKAYHAVGGDGWGPMGAWHPRRLQIQRPDHVGLAVRLPRDARRPGSSLIIHSSPSRRVAVQ